MRKALVSALVLAWALALGPVGARAADAAPGDKAAGTQGQGQIQTPADAGPADATDAATADAADAAPAEKADPNKKTAGKESGGSLSRINPFAPVVRPEEIKKPEPEPTAGPVPVAEPSRAPAAPGKVAEPPPPVLLKLNGILFSARMPVAVINDGIVGVGDAVEGYRIASIGPDLVTAEKEGVRYVMTPRCPTARPYDPAAAPVSLAPRDAPASAAAPAAPGAAPQTASAAATDAPAPAPPAPADASAAGLSPAADKAGQAPAAPWLCFDGADETFDCDTEAMTGEPPAGRCSILPGRSGAAAAAKAEPGEAAGLGALPALDPDEQGRIVSPLAKDVP